MTNDAEIDFTCIRIEEIYRADKLKEFVLALDPVVRDELLDEILDWLSENE